MDKSQYSLKNLYSKARELFGQTKQVASQGYSNLKGNVQALSNPETRQELTRGLQYSGNKVLKTPLPQSMQGFAQNVGKVAYKLQPIARPTGKLLEGYTEGGTGGLVDVPNQKSTNFIDKAAYATGYTAGLFTGPITKLGAMAKLDKVGAGATRKVLSKVAPTAKNIVTQKLLPALGAETAQSIGYGLAATGAGLAGLRPGYDFTPKNLAIDTALGMGFRGLGTAVPKALAKGAQAKKMHPEDVAAVDAVVDALKGRKDVIKARITLDRLAEHYVPKATIDELRGKAKTLHAKDLAVARYMQKMAGQISPDWNGYQLGIKGTDDISAKVGGSDPLEALKAEARKYGSAEEFYLRMSDATRDGLRKNGIRGQEAITDYWNSQIKNLVGAPKNQKGINPGDFITTNYDLAKSYTGDGNVLSLKVKAKDVLDDITEPLGEEYIYRPTQAKAEVPKQFNFNVDDGKQVVQMVETPIGKRMQIVSSSLKPKTQLLRQSNTLLNKGSELLDQERVRVEALKEQRNMYSQQSLDLINELKKYSKSKAFQEGDIETLRNNTPTGLVDRVVEAVREARMNENISDQDALQMALEIPSKSQLKIKLPQQILEARKLKKQAATLTDLVYNSETDPQALKIQASTAKRQLKQSLASDLDEYQKALFTQTGATKKTRDLEGSLVKSINDKMRELKPAQKVNALDYLRTPDKVLKKIGLGNVGEQLKESYSGYIKQVPIELKRVTSWHDQVKSIPNASRNIFKYLDGESIKLSPTEMRVANEMKEYLSDWANKLGLPKDRRVASYITHIFEDDFIKKEFDPDIADLIRDKVPGSVYDPFLQQRLGAKGYVEDAFKAMDAYVKRATRKYNMDPALEQLKSASDGLEDSAFNYVKALGDRVNMRPTHIDNLLDNLIKSSPIGYKLGQRPTAKVSRQIRQTIYRGTLGLNFGSAIRNLTQGANTYSQLGEVNTAKGYLKAVKSIMTGDDELVRSGVLADSFIQDRNMSGYKKFWEKLDKGLFIFFEAAEKINRGAAYFGGKSKALSQGLSEQEAIRAGVEMARKTQFTFGSVDTPVALQSDLVKLATQFQSFNVKQSEFLADVVKNKEYAGMVRWMGANALLLFTVGEMMGWDWKDFVPFSQVLEGKSPIGGSPLFTLAGDVTKIATGTPDKYGNPIKPTQLLKDAVPFLPAGVQVQKTVGGLRDTNRGYTETPKGLVKFPVSQSAGSYLTAAALGTSKLPEARAYRENETSQLGEQQSNYFKSLSPDQRQGYYSSVLQKRADNKSNSEMNDQLKAGAKVDTGLSDAKMYDKLISLDLKDQITPEIALAKYTDDLSFNSSGSRYQDAINEKRIWSKLDSLNSSQSLTDDQKAKATALFIEKAGIDKNDYQYYQIAKQSNDLKTMYALEEITKIQSRPGSKPEDLMNFLKQGRYEYRGNMVLSSGVIDNLVDEGILTYSEGKSLKKYTFDKDPKTKMLTLRKKRTGSKVKKPKKISLKAIKVPKIKVVQSSGKRFDAPKIKAISVKLRTNK